MIKPTTYTLGMTSEIAKAGLKNILKVKSSITVKPYQKFLEITVDILTSIK